MTVELPLRITLPETLHAARELRDALPAGLVDGVRGMLQALLD